MAISMQLSDYDISPDRGFLAHFDPTSVELPDFLRPIRTAALNLPHSLLTGRIRELLIDLPALDLEEFCANGDAQAQRLAMVHYSFLVQSYVWGEPEAPRSLPAALALPIWQLAKQLGQQPLLPYSGYVLDNWGVIDSDGPISLDNTRVIQSFLGGQDEAWFILIHVAIEARAGAMLAAIPALLNGAQHHDLTILENGLTEISSAWQDINTIFDRMPERCDPYVYFNRVRPWIHGWKNNPALGEGLIYEGVAETAGKPQSFRGQTGSQSSIVPTMDALFGVGHAADPLRTYLDELHIYRPPEHRRFIDAVRSHSQLRATISELGNSVLSHLYNDCINHMADFRSAHLKYAASYINRQSRGNASNHTEVGTGGTPFMKYLKKHRNETAEQLLPVATKKAG